MSIVEWIGLVRPSSLAANAKLALYRLIGLYPRAARRLDLYLSRRAYRKVYAREPDLTNPVLFSEKITARKLFERRAIFSTLADKLLARDFAGDRVGRQYLPELHFVCDRFEEIDFDKLPDQFVIKTNHGTHWIILVGNKGAFDKSAGRKLIRRWLRSNYYVNSREIFYKNIDRKILVEEYLEERSGAPVIDYKFFVYDGLTKFFSVSLRRSIGGERVVIYFDRACRRLPVQVDFHEAAREGAGPSVNDQDPGDSLEPFTLPPNMDQLFDIADRLGQGFDFMRVDLYSPGGRVVFGEFTSLPVGGLRPFHPPVYDRIFGEGWKLTLSDAGPEDVGAVGAGDI